MATSQFQLKSGKYKKGNGIEFMMFQNQVHMKEKLSKASGTMEEADNYQYHRMKRQMEFANKRA